jgi:hypothetical protein
MPASASARLLKIASVANVIVLVSVTGRLSTTVHFCVARSRTI